MQTPVEKAIWFIESHFSRDITLDDLARVCSLSRFQMSRLFSYATGKTVTAYVRGRRLTEAARALADGAPDILVVALHAGYGSHEAFSRAFRDQFGVSPAALRARGDLAGIALVEPLREDPAIAVRLPPPRLVSLGPLLIAGIGRRFASDDLAGIPALWQELHPHLGEIPGQKGNIAYGLVLSFAHDLVRPAFARRSISPLDTDVPGLRAGGKPLHTPHQVRGRPFRDHALVANMATAGETYYYLAGVEVSDLSDLDSSFTGIRLPAQRWAVFPHADHITTIVSTIHAVFAQALPAAGLAPGHMPDLLERYDESFNPWTGTGGFEIWVPVA
jgi:AraC family transcriptional regulator